jgi:hypothetical protein
MRDHPRSPVYDVYALATAGAGFSSPKHVRRASAISRRFFHACFNYGGLRGEPAKAAGVLTGRSANPALIRHHSFSNDVGGLQTQLGVASNAHR